jgi:Domain of unknown function (DUF4384)
MVTKTDSFSNAKTQLRFSLLLVAVFFILPYSSSAQEKKKVKQIKGEWVLSNDITPTQARENAINQAKLEAMRKAGVPEVISESNLLYQTDNPQQIKELFESLTSVAISGEVSEFKIVKEDKRINEFNSIIYEVWIDATVVIHKNARDQGLNFDVKGIHESYASPDKLTFDVTPWKDGYLTVFIVSEKESLQLYPAPQDRQVLLEGHKNYTFPRSRGIDYEVSTEGNLEVNYVVMLFTRQEISFTKEPTAANILKFVSSIDASDKAVKTFSLLIKK